MALQGLNIAVFRKFSAEFFNFASRTNGRSRNFNVRHHFKVEMDKVIMAFAVTDKEIAVIVPANTIRRNFLDVAVAFKLHFSVRCNFEILKSNSFSCFDCGYYSVDIKTDFFVFLFYFFFFIINHNTVLLCTACKSCAGSVGCNSRHNRRNNISKLIKKEDALPKHLLFVLYKIWLLQKVIPF